jgi:hypothetical protein
LRVRATATPAFHTALRFILQFSYAMDSEIGRIDTDSTRSVAAKAVARAAFHAQVLAEITGPLGYRMRAIAIPHLSFGEQCTMAVFRLIWNLSI